MSENNIDKPSPHKDILYYDGSCPLCAKEIAWLEKYQNGKLALVDINQPNALPKGISKEAMLRVLHLQTESGDWLKGLDATVKSWSHTPYGWIVKPLRWPLLSTIADSAYHYWANTRYQKRYACQRCQ